MAIADPAPSDVPRALVVSESLLLRIGMRVLMGQAGIAEVIGESGTSHRLGEAVRAAAADVVVVAPVDGANEPLFDALDALAGSCAVVLLLPVPAFRIQSATMRTRHDFDCAPLNVTPYGLREIVRGAVSRPRGAPRVYEIRGVGGCGTLTPREQEVLRELARGLSNRELADSLVVSEDTIKSHLRQTYRKLGVATRGEAIARYVEQLGGVQA